MRRRVTATGPGWGRAAFAALFAGALTLLAAGAGGPATRATEAAATLPPPRLVDVRVRDGLVHDRATGVVVGPGRVLTVAHVLGDERPRAGALEVGSTSGCGRDPRSTRPDPARCDRGARGVARVLRVDPAADLALLAVPGVRGPAVTLAPRTPAVVTVGLPGGARRTSARTLRATYTDVTGTTVRRPVLRLSTAVRRGDSGSPVLDHRGRLAGVVFATARDRTDVAWATAAPPVRALLADPPSA